MNRINCILIVTAAALTLGPWSAAGESAFERISQHPLVAHRLQWVGTDGAKEPDSFAFEEALSRSKTSDVTESLIEFMAEHPENGWTPSVRLSFAKGYCGRGLTTKGLEALRNGWRDYNGGQSRAGREIADQFLGTLSQVLATLGRVEELEGLFAAADGREFVSGGAARMWRDSHEGYFTMKHYPQVAFRCGTFALSGVFQVLKKTESFRDEPSPTNGFALGALAELARKQGVAMRAVKRMKGKEIPSPSVIHWKQEHYAAIVGRERGLVKVVDATSGGKRWMSEEEVNQEASGYFLVGEDFLSPEFATLSEEAAVRVRGKGQPNNIKDEEDQGCNRTPGGVGAPETGLVGEGSSEAECVPCEGLARSWVTEPYINLFVADQPMSYQTSKGSFWKFRLTYKQRDYDLDNTIIYTSNFPDSLSHAPRRHLGMTNAAWNHNWMSHIRYLDSAGQNTFEHFNAIVFFPGGGAQRFSESELNSRQGPASLRLESLGAILPIAPTDGVLEVCNTENSTNGFRLIYPDGSQDIYGVALVTSVFGGVSAPAHAEAYLTQRIDAQGRKTKICYEKATAPGGAPVFYRIKNIVDFDGKTSTFSYDPNFIDMVTQVSDPYGRHCDMEYDSSGRLHEIHDAAGLTSQINYVSGTSGHIDSLVTPYGTTRFAYYEANYVEGTNGFQGNLGGHGRVNRAITVQEPNSARHLYLYAYDATNHVPALFSSGEVPVVSGLGATLFDNGIDGNSATNASLRFRNSFYWGPRQYATLTETNSVFLDYLTTADYERGRWRHWLDSTAADTVSDRLSLERLPSPATDGSIPGAKIWHGYVGKQGAHRAGYRDNGFTGVPRAIAQVLPDGTTQFVTYTYNSVDRVSAQSSSYTTNGTVGIRTRNFGYAGIDLTSISGFQGQTLVSMQYNQYHQVTNLVDLAGTTRFAYEATNHNLTSIAWPSGLEIVQGPFFPTQRAYVTNGAVLGTNFYSYSNGTVRASTDLRGLTRVFTRDGLDRLTSITYSNDNSTGQTNLLDATAIKDRNNHWTYFEYNPVQQITGVTNGLNITKYVYCGCGSLEQIQATNETWVFGYDNQGRRTTTTLLGTSPFVNRVYQHQFDAVGRLTNIIDHVGNSFKYAYNNQGLPTELRNALGPVATAIYDADDRPAYQTDAQTMPVELTYDNLDRLTKRHWPDGDEIIGYTANLYSATSYQNQKGDLTQYDYDAFEQLRRMTNGGVKTAELSYSPAGDPLRFQNGNNKLVRWSLDLEGRVKSRTNQIGVEVARMTYDAEGRLTNRWTLEKGDVGFAYDDAGNLRAIDFVGSGQNPDISYDSANRLTSMVDEIGTTSFTQIPGFAFSENGPFNNDTVSRTWTNGLPETLRLINADGSAGMLWRYVPDANRRLDTISVSSSSGLPSFTLDYDYLGAGNLIQRLTLGSYGVITNKYDSPMYRWDETWLRRPNGYLLNSQKRSYNNAGQVEDLYGTFTNKLHFGYDSRGQITAALGTEPGGASRFHEQFQYGYDSAGNLTNRVKYALNATFGVNDANRLTTVGLTGTLTVSGMAGYSTSAMWVNGGTPAMYVDGSFARTNVALNVTAFSATSSNVVGASATDSFPNRFTSSISLGYDQNGNLTSTPGRILQYDALDRLRTVIITNGPSDSKKVEYTYDGWHRQRVRQEYTWTGNAWSSPITRKFIHDGRLLIQERDGNDTVLVTYTWGVDLSGDIGAAGGIGGLLARTDQTTGITGFYQTDQSGNVIAIVGPNGYLLARYWYDPFGGLIGATGDWAEANLYRFSTKRMDPLTGMYDFGFRWYDPSLQRWINEDPLGEEGGLNLYGFVGNNPISDFDPFGWSDFNRPPHSISFPAGGGSSVTYGPPSPELTRYDGNETSTLEQFRNWERANDQRFHEEHPDLARWMDLFNKYGGYAGGMSGISAKGGIRLLKCPPAKGGTYRLFDDANMVMKTGRTKDLARREKELGRKHPDLDFKVDKRTDNYAQQRGREEIIYNQQNPAAPLDKIRPINPSNENAARYRKAGKQL